jgi:murein DD-endopeptidase MepM/ murein hydrolase activator NlpD
VRWIRGSAMACVAMAAAGLVLGGCSSGDSGGTTGVAGGAEAPLWQSAPATSPAPGATTVRPSPSAATPSGSAKAARTKPVTYAFPVVGRNSYAHTHHDYPATDIITNCGNRVVAATSGTILDVTKVDRWKRSVNAGATRGGLSVSLLGDDGVRYYGSHLSVITAGIGRGVRVSTGQTLGKTGDTGDASACHLHFGISPPCAKVGDWWTQRGAIYPWPYLDAWRKGQNKSAVSAVKAWHGKHGCPRKPLVDP